jgi:hypothetical protein
MIGVNSGVVAHAAGRDQQQRGKPDLLSAFLRLAWERPPLLLLAWTVICEIFFDIRFAAALRWLHRTNLPWTLGGWAAVVIAGNWLVPSGKTDPMPGVMVAPLLLESTIGSVVALCVSRLNRTAAIVPSHWELDDSFPAPSLTWPTADGSHQAGIARCSAARRPPRCLPVLLPGNACRDGHPEFVSRPGRCVLGAVPGAPVAHCRHCLRMPPFVVRLTAGGSSHRIVGNVCCCCARGCREPPADRSAITPAISPTVC